MIETVDRALADAADIPRILNHYQHDICHGIDPALMQFSVPCPSTDCEGTLHVDLSVNRFACPGTALRDPLYLVMHLDPQIRTRLDAARKLGRILGYSFITTSSERISVCA